MLAGVAAKRCHAPNFAEKTFVNSYKASKFAKAFSLEVSCSTVYKPKAPLSVSITKPPLPPFMWSSRVSVLEMYSWCALKPEAVQKLHKHAHLLSMLKNTMHSCYGSPNVQGCVGQEEWLVFQHATTVLTCTQSAFSGFTPFWLLLGSVLTRNYKPSGTKV